MKKQIGIVNKKVIQLLDLKYTKELPIIIGESNLAHMQKEHPKDFEKYGNAQKGRFFLVNKIKSCN